MRRTSEREIDREIAANPNPSAQESSADALDAEATISEVSANANAKWAECEKKTSDTVSVSL